MSTTVVVDTDVVSYLLCPRHSWRAGITGPTAPHEHYRRRRYRRSFLSVQEPSDRLPVPSGPNRPDADDLVYDPGGIGSLGARSSLGRDPPPAAALVPGAFCRAAIRSGSMYEVGRGDRRGSDMRSEEHTS